MHFLPWYTAHYHSPLPPAELLRRVQANTAPSLNEAAPSEPHQSAAFQGWVKHPGMFRLSYLSRFKDRYGRRYSAMTVVEGEVSAGTGSGSTIRLLHRPALFALFALGFWLVLFGTLLLASLLMWLRGQHGEYASWGPSVASLALLLGFWAQFWWEVYKAQQLLRPLLQLQPLLAA